MQNNYAAVDNLCVLVEGKIRQLEDLYRQQLNQTSDLYALSLLQPVLNAGPYLPFAKFSLRPARIARVLNDIVLNGRKSLLEFGTGMSTIMIARLARMNSLQLKLLSVEHDRKWVETMQEAIRGEGLEDFATILYAPLTSCSLAIGSNLWYDLDVLASTIGDMLFDFVLIDGPPAFDIIKAEARYPGFLYAYGRLASNSAVYLDDALRTGEKAILEKWETRHNIKFSIAEGSLAVFTKGAHFDSTVLR